jgi:hypothetical protein
MVHENLPEKNVEETGGWRKLRIIMDSRLDFVPFSIRKPHSRLPWGKRNHAKPTRQRPNFGSLKRFKPHSRSTNLQKLETFGQILTKRVPVGQCLAYQVSSYIDRGQDLGPGEERLADIRLCVIAYSPLYVSSQCPPVTPVPPGPIYRHGNTLLTLFTCIN